MTMKPTTSSPSYWVLLLSFVVVGVPFSVGVVDTVAAIQLSADTQQTEGTVVAFEGGGGKVRKPVVEYRVADQTYRCTGAVATNLPIHAVGDQVSVLYKINEPGVAFIDSFFDRWLGPLSFTVAGFGFLVVLLLVTVQKIKAHRHWRIGRESISRRKMRTAKNA